jgi:hypothetical protein
MRRIETFMSRPTVLENTWARVAAILTLVAIFGALVVAPISTGAAPKPQVGSGALTVPITGTSIDPTTGDTFTSFTGTFTAQQFKASDGQITVLGTVAGTVTNALGQTIGTVTQQVTVPVSASGDCQILHLELGPLDLDLLGLQVHLDRVVLDITAQQGPGNLLGNLLCAIAGLLDGGISLNTIASQLNVLVDVLKQLGLA